MSASPALHVAADLEEFRRLTVVIARHRRHVSRSAAQRRTVAVRLRDAGVSLSVVAAKAGITKAAVQQVTPPLHPTAASDSPKPQQAQGATP